MKKPPTALLRSDSIDAHQELAAAVIHQAVLDAASPDESERVRVGARAFLAGSPMLQLWCSVAGLDPHVVQAKCLKRESTR